MDPSDTKMDLGPWTLFSLLDRTFLSSVRLACVFGNLGNEALLVSAEDEVGMNHHHFQAPMAIQYIAGLVHGFQRRRLPGGGRHAVLAAAQEGGGPLQQERDHLRLRQRAARLGMHAVGAALQLVMMFATQICQLNADCALI